MAKKSYLRILPDTITLHYPDPDDEDAEIDVEYVRQEIAPGRDDRCKSPRDGDI